MDINIGLFSVVSFLKKKRIHILLGCILFLILVSTVFLFNISPKSTVITGTLFIDSEPAPMGVGVRIVFSTGVVSDIDGTDEDGRYNIDVSEYIDSVGIFYIYYNETEYIARNHTGDIFELAIHHSTEISIDLYIFISTTNTVDIDDSSEDESSDDENTEDQIDTDDDIEEIVNDTSEDSSSGGSGSSNGGNSGSNNDDNTSEDEIAVIHATSGTGGGIDPFGNITVLYGEWINFSIIANEGYHISDVVVDVISQGSLSYYNFSNVSENHSIQALFALNEYMINASSGIGGRIESNGEIITQYGSSKNFSILPDIGYHIENIIVDGLSVGVIETYQFKDIESNHSIEALFALNQYNLTIILNGTGSGDVTTNITGPYMYGTTIRIWANASIDSAFLGFSGDLSGLDSPQVLMIDDNKTVTAEFEKINQPPMHDTPLLISEYKFNSTNEALFCYNQSTSDADSDIVTNTYQWFKNGVSLTNLSFPFNVNDSSIVEDYSGYGNHGIVQGATWMMNGNVGGGYHFDGIDDYLQIPYSKSLDGNGSWGELTIEYWLYLNNDQTSKTVIGKYGGTGVNQRSYLMYISSTTNKLFGAVAREGNKYIYQEYSTILTKNVWYHVVMVYESGEGLRMYLNGQLNGEKPDYSGNIQASPGEDLFIGCRYGTQAFFDGMIDELKIYPFALTDTQIQQNYHDSKDGLSNVSSITKEETSLGDIWVCHVTPSDGKEDGITKPSNSLAIVPVYELTISQSGPGTVEVSPPGPYYEETLVTLWANATNNSVFIGWSGALNTTTSPETLLMDADKTVYAEFLSTTAITIDTDFDSGNLGSYTIEGHTINLTLHTEYLINSDTYYTYWMNFKVKNILEKNVTFHITNADLSQFLSNDTHGSCLVYSYDGISWDRFTNYSYESGNYSFWMNFTENEVQIATFFPFSYGEMQEYLAMVNESYWAQTVVLGKSSHDKNIPLLSITNPDIDDTSKKIIYILGRQHAAETAGTHMIKGLVDYLISNTSEAQHLRDSFLWYIIPMVNPDGVFFGNSRGNGTENNIDLNRDWNNPQSTEVAIVKAHLDAINTTKGIDLFIDWHSQMNDVSWYNYVYAPPASNHFYEDGLYFCSLLSKHTDFDVFTTPGLGSTSARGYASNLGLFTFTFEPTPHLHSWTIESLEEQGRLTGDAIKEFFPLLVDSEFNDSIDSNDLIAKNETMGWYESRNNDPRLVSLDINNIAGNTGKKAAFLTDDITNFVYLTQSLRSPQTGRFTVSLDIYIDKMSEYIIPEQNYYYNRTGMIFIGTDADGTNGPCSTSTERFITLAFHDETPGDTGDDLILMARERSNQSWYRTHEWTPIVNNLSYDTWYTLQLDIDIMNHNYTITLNDDLLHDNVAGYSSYTPTVLTDISFYAGGTGRGDYYIDNVFSPAHQRKRIYTNTIGNGSIHISPSESTYEPSTDIILTAISEPGWSFARWQGDINETSNPIQFPVSSHINITALFIQDEYNITLQQQGEGTILLEPTKPSYHYGESVLVTVYSDNGSVFTHWTDDLNGHTNPSSLIITRDTTITAHFSTTADKILTATVNGSGYITIEPDRAVYEQNSIITLNAIGDPGWTFLYWTGDVSLDDVNQTNISIQMDTDKNLVVHFKNSIPIVETLPAINITSTSATLQGQIINNSGESCTVWFEYDTYELGDCMGTIATGTVCKDGRSIIHKNRHYGVDNQKPRYYQGVNFTYFGIGHTEGMIRMGQNEKGLALVNMDVNHLLINWNYQSDFGSGSEDNDFHNTLGQFETVRDTAYYLAFHGTYGYGSNGVAGQYLIISSEPGVGAIVAIDKVGHSNITWVNNTYAALTAGAWYCDGQTGVLSRRAKTIMDDIVINGTSSDNDHLLNWKDIVQRIAKDTYDRELGTGSYYYGDAISRGTSRSATVHVGGNNSFNNSIHMSWLNFGEMTQIGIFLPLYAGNLHSTDDIPSNFTLDNNGLGIHPYVTEKRLYARGDLNNNYFYSDRVREILYYAEYNENITFQAFDHLMDTIMYSADSLDVQLRLADFAHTLTPLALKGYISNITSQSQDTSKIFPQDQGVFTDTIYGLRPGTLYYYQAWANNTAGISNGEQQMFLTRPETPTDSILTRTQPQEAQLSWTKGAGAHFTVIERNAINTPAWDRGTGILIYNGTGVSCEDTGLNPGVEYYYQIWSYTLDRGLYQYSSEHITIYTGVSPPQQLLMDSLFDQSQSSNELRINQFGQDWYESRNQPPSDLVLLDITNIAGNQGKKAKIFESIEQNAYLTQEFSSPQTENFTVQYDIYMDSIKDISVTDRSGWMMIGDDTDGINGPCSTNDDRFLIMVFEKPSGGTTGTMNLNARGYNDPQDQFTIIAEGLHLDQWYTIRVDLHVEQNTYDIYLNGEYQKTMDARNNKTSVSHLSFAQWTDGAGTFIVDNVFAYKPGTGNTPPMVFNESPPNEEIDIPISLQNLSFMITDAQDQLLNYTIETSPLIGFSIGLNETSGLKICDISSLSYGTTYTWFVNVTDGTDWTRIIYTFTTEDAAANNPVILSDILPSNNSIQIPINTTELTIMIMDPEDDLINWTIETIPDIGRSQGDAELSGVKTCLIQNLSYSTIYTIYVNATDGNSWTNETYTFKTEDAGLLVDYTFDDSLDSDDLRYNSLYSDWYESRNDNPLLLTLDTSEIGGNTGKKAALKGAGTGLTAYLSQELEPIQSSSFNVSCSIYIDSIDNYSNYDRTGFIFLGNDIGGTNGPCSTGSERFVYLTFYDATPGDSGDDIIIKAREWTSNQSWGTTSQWTTVATNLSYKTWYNLSLNVDVFSGTYNVSIDGILTAEDIRKNIEYTSDSITHFSFSTGGTARGDFYVDNVYAFGDL